MRHTSVFRSPEAFFVLFGGIWAFVGVPFLVIGAYVTIKTLSLNSRLEREGQVVPGVVLEKFTRSQQSSRSYWVRYRFTAPRGENMEGRAEIQASVWSRLRERGPISVTYAASDPSSHRAEGQRTDWVLPVVFAGVGGVLGPVGAVILGIGVKRFRRRRRIEREGVIAEATVTRVVERNVSINRVRQWTIHYTYTDYRGQIHDGDSGLIPPQAASGWQPGDKGKVRFDPGRPEDSIWAGRDASRL